MPINMPPELDQRWQNRAVDFLVWGRTCIVTPHAYFVEDHGEHFSAANASKAVCVRADDDIVAQSDLACSDALDFLPQHRRRLEKALDVVEHYARLISRRGDDQHITNFTR